MVSDVSCIRLENLDSRLRGNDGLGDLIDHSSAMYIKMPAKCDQWDSLRMIRVFKPKK